jgi:hypothetical protein
MVSCSSLPNAVRGVLVDGAPPIDGVGGVDLTYGVWIGVPGLGD